MRIYRRGRTRPSSGLPCEFEWSDYILSSDHILVFVFVGKSSSPACDALTYHRRIRVAYAVWAQTDVREPTQRGPDDCYFVFVLLSIMVRMASDNADHLHQKRGERRGFEYCLLPRRGGAVHGHQERPDQGLRVHRKGCVFQYRSGIESLR